MIPATALRIAGAHHDAPAHLVARPAGVLHVYVGPLTPGGGRSVPSRRRPVCNRRSRRLYVTEVPPCLGRDRMRRLCRSCSARLALLAGQHGPGGQLLHTAESVLFSVLAATTEPELDLCRAALVHHVPAADWARQLDLPALAARRYGLARICVQTAIARERSTMRGVARTAGLYPDLAEPAA